MLEQGRARRRERVPRSGNVVQVSWENSALKFGFGNAGYSFNKSGRAHVERLTLRSVECALERRGDDMPQAVVDFVQGPGVILRALHPLEIGDGYASGICKD